MADFNFLRLALLITVAVYFVFEHFDEKQIKDEREELIRLKTYELVHKVTTMALCLIALTYCVFPWMNALYPVLALIFAFFYTEVLGKIYFRRKI